MPPGTGDIQLTLAQKVPVTGSVIVTTPHIALFDARKGIRMFEKAGADEIVENMSMHICGNCGHAEPIFGEGVARAWGRISRCRCWASSPWICGSGRVWMPVSLSWWPISESPISQVLFDSLSSFLTNFRNT